MINKRADIAQMILVVGVVFICSLALLSFNISNLNIRNSFDGLGLVEQLNSQIEENYFYKQQTGTGKVTEDVLVERDLIKAMNYAKENEKNKLAGRTCDCGDKCGGYVSSISKSSSENGISDPILLLALMMQESDCTANAFSGSSTGLMQINLIHCGEYGLPSGKEECKQELMNNPEKNIEVGAKILKQYYNTFGEGKEFHGCNKVKDYDGWEAALRAYNGWGCDPNIPEQDNFVEEVMRRYGILKGGYLEKEKTEGILWWIKKTITFSVEYKGSL
jgi:hypothetical protein